jgi:hypothetical protein
MLLVVSLSDMYIKERVIFNEVDFHLRRSTYIPILLPSLFNDLNKKCQLLFQQLVIIRKRIRSKDRLKNVRSRLFFAFYEIFNDTLIHLCNKAR